MLDWCCLLHINKATKTLDLEIYSVTTDIQIEVAILTDLYK